MDVEDLWKELGEVGQSFLGEVSTEVARVMFQARCYEVINRFYAAGGRLADRWQVPIEKFEDVELVVTRGTHSMGVSAIRKYPRCHKCGSIMKYGTGEDEWPDGQRYQYAFWDCTACGARMDENSPYFFYPEGGE